MRRVDRKPNTVSARFNKTEQIERDV